MCVNDFMTNNTYLFIEMYKICMLPLYLRIFLFYLPKKKREDIFILFLEGVLILVMCRVLFMVINIYADLLLKIDFKQLFFFFSKRYFIAIN